MSATLQLITLIRSIFVICICQVLSNHIAKDISCIINTKDCIQQYSAVLRTDVHSPFDVHCCHMGTAIKHFVPERVKPSFVIF